MAVKQTSFAAGFTLVEVLVTLVIVSVAVLSLGSFSLGVVGSGQVDRERLTAIHLAEQVIEYWQHDAKNYAPKISAVCTLAPNTTAPTYPLSPPNCTPTSGVGISYAITMGTIRATAPLPPDPNKNGTNPGAGVVIRAMIGSTSSQPDFKIVTVSWSYKGKTRSVYLTSMVAPK